MRRRSPCARRAATIIVLSAATILLISCGSGGSPAEQTTSPPTTVAPTSTSEAAVPTSTTTAASTESTAASSSVTTGPASAMSAEDAQAVRDVASAFWDAYNAYDPDKAVSYLDESYRPAKEQVLRDEIGRIKTFGVQLGVSEKTAPALIGTDEAEMYLNMKEPTGTRTLWMKFARRGDTWAVTYSEQTK